MTVLVVSDRALELMYADYVGRAIGTGVVTFLEYKLAFFRSTGWSAAE